jgi:hypothetical protein
VDRMKVWMKQGEEVLSADAIARALPDVNRKILLSLQKFMVRVVRIAFDEPFRLMVPL